MKNVSPAINPTPARVPRSPPMSRIDGELYGAAIALGDLIEVVVEGGVDSSSTV